MSEEAPTPPEPDDAGASVVVGLGNPGSHYAATRHNCGFLAVERLAERWGWSLATPQPGAPAWACGSWRGRRIALVKPLGYMNRSGDALRWLHRRIPVEAERVLVLYDDADLQLGRLRVRRRGSAGGHNGIRSLTDALGTERFPRVKLGVRGAGREGVDLADYVLAPFEADELPIVEEMLETAAEAVESWLEEGTDAAMNRFNRAPQTSQATEGDDRSPDRNGEREPAARGVTGNTDHPDDQSGG